MKISTMVWGLVALLIIVGGGIFLLSHTRASMDTLGEGSTTSATTTTQIPGDNLALGQNSSATLGNFLVAYNGMTLYAYAPDTTNVSTCTGTCAAQWPPYTVNSTNLVGESPIGGVIATTVRADGTKQLTYNGHPLYFFKGDTSVNDTKGQAVAGAWYVLKP